MSIARAEQLQRIVENANAKKQAAESEHAKQLRRLIDCLERTILENPQLLRTERWLFFHALNTLNWDTGKIAAVLGITQPEVITEFFR